MFNINGSGNAAGGQPQSNAPFGATREDLDFIADDIDSLDDFADDISQNLQLQISWDSPQADGSPSVTILSQDEPSAIARNENHPPFRTISPNLGGKLEAPFDTGNTPLSFASGTLDGHGIQIDSGELERTIQQHLSQQFGAYINFGKGPEKTRLPSDHEDAVSAQDVRLRTNQSSGASFTLAGTTDFHITASGRLRREKVNETVSPGPDGFITLSLLPGSYELKQTEADPDFLLNERPTTIMVGSEHYAVDGVAGRDYPGLSIPKAARRCRPRFIAAEGGAPIANAKWLAEGDMDGMEGPSSAYAARFTSDSRGKADFYLPLGRFIIAMDKAPYAPVMRIDVTEPSWDIDEMSVLVE